MKLTVITIFTLVSALAFLSGCDDPEARNSAAQAASQINDLKLKLEDAKKRNEETVLSLKAVEERLVKHLDERADKISDLINGNQKKMLEQLGQDVERSRKDAMGLADSSRAENNKELAVTRAQVAADMSKMREELKAAADELHKFMDNQLKELYPYAYQPKRLDPSVPPAVNETK